MKVTFYSFGKISFEKGLVKVIEKAYSSNQNIFIKTNSDDQTNFIDKILWEQDSSSWLPHGVDNDQNHPILINKTINNTNKSSILVILDDSEIPLHSEFNRCLYIFNGKNSNSLQNARCKYKQLLEKNADLEYHDL